MNIVITGANGFIGSRLGEHLVEQGHTVTGLGRSPMKDSSFKYIEKDILDFEGLEEIFSGNEAVIHCAGKAGVWGDYEAYEVVNVGGTRNVLHSAKAVGVKRFINLSTPSLYFQKKHQLNLKETDVPVQVGNAYGRSKWMAEQTVHILHDIDFYTISLRPRGVIGRGDQQWMPRILQLHEKKRLFRISEHDTQVDFTSVENLIHAIELALTAPHETGGRAYNITNGAPESLWSFIEELTGEPVKSVPGWALETAARLSELLNSVIRPATEPALLPIKLDISKYDMTLDISDAKENLKYNPTVTSQQSLEDFKKWWKDQA